MTTLDAALSHLFGVLSRTPQPPEVERAAQAVLESMGRVSGASLRAERIGYGLSLRQIAASWAPSGVSHTYVGQVEQSALVTEPTRRAYLAALERATKC